jgi:hypothetical protein
VPLVPATWPAQATDQHVDRTAERIALPPLGEVEKLIARQHAAGPVEEDAEKFELPGGQCHFLALWVVKPAGRGVGGEPGETEHPVGRRLRRFPATAEDGADAGYQLTRVERLRQIVVGADFQADDPVDLLLQRGQQDDRHVLALAAQVAADLQAGAVRQHDVQHDKVDLGIGKGLLELPTVGGERHAKTLGIQVTAKKPPDFLIVVHDENMGRCLYHASFIGRRLGGPRRDFCNGACLRLRLQCSETNPAPAVMLRNVPKECGNGCPLWFQSVMGP